MSRAIALRLRSADYEYFRMRAEGQGTTVSKLAAAVLAEWLQRQEGGEEPVARYPLREEVAPVPVATSPTSERLAAEELFDEFLAVRLGVPEEVKTTAAACDRHPHCILEDGHSGDCYV